MRTYYIEFYDGASVLRLEKIRAATDASARAVFKMLHRGEGCVIISVETYESFCIKTYGKLI